jgi:hypothetical protein
MMFILDYEWMFNNRLCYDNVDDYDFLSCKMFSH